MERSWAHVCRVSDDRGAQGMERNIGDQLNKAFEAYRKVSIEKDNAKKELQKMTEYYERYTQELQKQIEDQQRLISELEAKLSAASQTSEEIKCEPCNHLLEGPGTYRTPQTPVCSRKMGTVAPNLPVSSSGVDYQDMQGAFEAIQGRFRQIQSLTRRQKDHLKRFHRGCDASNDACPYHNPTTTMGHSIHNIDISKALTHTTPHTLSAICPEQCKPRFIREENTCPMCQTPSNVSICPLKSVTATSWSQVKTPMRKTSMQLSFPETVSGSLCRNCLVMQTNCFSNCLSGWSQTILEVNLLDVEVLGWCGYTSSAVARPVGCTAIFSETPLEMAYGREMNIQCMSNRSG
ncbi:TRAF family member-associated NF-kappa-B activator isoform X7 [Nothobranchius furzeri]|uniref:TRAF family member-associated NF-kappa-B activator isoform X7 n=1 Tax=Nothobranchius furzeri TaxID=105023 RepID=UPI003904D32E